MDPNVRWLRRVVISRVTVRLLTESSVAALAVFFIGRVAELDLALAIAYALVSAQAFVVVRVGLALFVNPVSYRYLMRWDDASDLLEPVGSDLLEPNGSNVPTDDDLVELIEENGFRRLVVLGNNDTDDLYVVHTSPAGLVMLVTTPQGELVVLTRLSDDRLLVSACELVLPHSRLVVNQKRRAQPKDLVASHVHVLEDMLQGGLYALETGSDTAIEQLRLEWECWNQLGPFIGPFVAVASRSQPLLLQASVSEVSLRERTMSLTDPAAIRPESVTGRSASLRVADAA